jgi:hypothetical protein
VAAAPGGSHSNSRRIEWCDSMPRLARAIRVFQGAMARNRSLNSQVLLDSRAREQRAEQIESSVEAFRGAIGDVMRAITGNASAMRDTAQSITKVHRMPADAPAPPNSCRPRSRRLADRSVNPLVSSDRPDFAPKSRSAKLKVSRRQTSASTCGKQLSALRAGRTIPDRPRQSRMARPDWEKNL